MEFGGKSIINCYLAVYYASEGVVSCQANTSLNSTTFSATTLAKYNEN